jgi:hypothetical protein
VYKEEIIRDIDQIVHAWNCRKISADKCIKLIREKVGLEEIKENGINQNR